jgi:hypothetical protein
MSSGPSQMSQIVYDKFSLTFTRVKKEIVSLHHAYNGAQNQMTFIKILHLQLITSS